MTSPWDALEAALRDEIAFLRGLVRDLTLELAKVRPTFTSAPTEQVSRPEPPDTPGRTRPTTPTEQVAGPPQTPGRTRPTTPEERAARQARGQRPDEVETVDDGPQRPRLAERAVTATRPASEAATLRVIEELVEEGRLPPSVLEGLLPRQRGARAALQLPPTDGGAAADAAAARNWATRENARKGPR